jgi:GntR family transcriptional regulator
MLDRGKDLPLYRQLEEVIRGKIEKGIWSPGQLIPSEMDLIKEYGISRTTVREALGGLVAEGILQREQGRGTFVSEPKFEHPLTEATSFTYDILNKGRKPGSITLFAEEVIPSAKIASRLQLRNPSRVVMLERIRTVDGEPVGLHSSSIVRALVPDLELNELRKNDISLYEILQKRMELHLKEAVETLEASVADERQSQLLRVAKGSPVLHIERITYLENNCPIEHVDMVYRADRYKSVVKLRVSTKELK